MKICRFPDPILKQPTHLIERIDDELLRTIDRLVATMRAHPRCVGLAAPQVGIGRRLAVMDASVHPKMGAGSHGLLVMINPKILSADGQSIQREGCLSIPDFTANVGRSTRVHVRTWDQDGGIRELRLEDFEAIVSQHEIDHLDGKLFLDPVANLATDVFKRKSYG